jgi:hypothetical protein
VVSRHQSASQHANANELASDRRRDHRGHRSTPLMSAALAGFVHDHQAATANSATVVLTIAKEVLIVTSLRVHRIIQNEADTVTEKKSTVRVRVVLPEFGLMSDSKMPSAVFERSRFRSRTIHSSRTPRIAWTPPFGATVPGALPYRFQVLCTCITV